MPSISWLRAVALLAVAAIVVAVLALHSDPAALDGVPPAPGDPVPAIDTHAHGRPADQLNSWASSRAPALGMPQIALEAYAYAAKVAEVENPKCHLAWPTLAGIGMVESKNGTYQGAVIGPNGDVTPPIRGVRLDGTHGNLALGKGGGANGFEQAMGPMQIIPETWRRYGVDAHNNGISSPDNIDDAALTAAGYLCNRGGDLGTAQGWMKAILAYNNSREYARSVRDWASAYAAGHPL